MMIYGDPWHGNDPLPLFGGPAEAPKKSFWDMLAQTWPSRMAQSAYEAVKLPGDVYSGVTPMVPPGLRREDFTDAAGWQQPNDAVIGRASDLAGLVASGTFTGPPSGSIGSSISWARRGKPVPESNLTGDQIKAIYDAVAKSERNQKNKVRDAINASGVSNDKSEIVSDVVSDIGSVRRSRQEMAHAFPRDAMADLWYEFRLKDKYTRERQLDNFREKKAISEYKNLDSEGLWSDTFKNIKPYDVNHAAQISSSATLEAVPRALKDLGWRERHVSVGKNNSPSSVYMVAPDKSYQVRISNHWLPETEQRAYKYESRGFGENWNNDVVINPRLSPKSHLDGIISEYNRWLSEIE